jgi:hypothetical protein
MDRKQFIQGFFRLSILLLIGALVSFFAVGKKIGLNEGCNEREQCKACGKLNNCSLPEAEKYRRNG